MPGSLTSMPNSAVPLIFAAVSSRLTGLPTYRESRCSLSFTSVGTGSLAAASASSP